MLPTGTALAATVPSATPSPGTPTNATPAPATPTTEPAQDLTAKPAHDPADEPAPEPTDEPTPDPTDEPTDDPTPDPTETVDPTPTPEPCAPLALAPLGDPGDAVGRVTLQPKVAACFTVTVEKPGLHRLLVADQYSYPSLYAGEEHVECEDSNYRDSWCELAAGTYTLKVVHYDWETVETRVALIPLTAAPGCPDVAGTGYDSAPTTGRATDRLGVVCHAFTAAPGDRITADFRLDEYGGAQHWITDGTGKRLCPYRNEDDSDGCVLPEGTGGYRVLAEVREAEHGFPAAYTLKVRRLSHPAGCVPVAATAYGSAPAQAAPGTECRTFTPAATGRYDVRSVDADGAGSGIEVYAADGSTVCAYGEDCALTAGVPYTLLTGSAVRILDRAATRGCEDGLVLARDHRGTFAVPGEVDCLNLPVPQGARIAVLTDRAGDVTVVDAQGAVLCSDGLTDGTCALGGTAPYRALVTESDPYREGDGYGLVVHRTDLPSACRTFLPGDFSGKPVRMSVKSGGGVFADCLTVPAGGHSARELVQIQKVSGASAASVGVLDATGKQVCSISSSYNTFSTCALTPGLAHTVLVQGRDVPGEFALTRLDVTATARGCVPTPAVPVGGPSTGGVPAAPGTFLCHRVTTAGAGDALHLNVRDVRSTARLLAYDASGDVVCDYFAAGCAATGSTAYQVLVQVPDGKTAAPAYRLDALRIGTAAGPAPECVRVPNVSYGFGPLTGTLSEQRTAICAVLPTASGDYFDVRFTPAGTFEQSPTPWMYDRATLKSNCHGSYSSEGENYQCYLPGAYPKASRPSTVVIGLPEQPARASTAVRADFPCTFHLCGPDERTVGTVGPATVGRGRVTMTVTGSALHESAAVELSSGGFHARSTTVSVAPDRRSMTVALDLTNAPLGPLSASVFAHGMQYLKGSVTVVAALRATATPTVTGTAVVGGKVTASAGSWSPSGASYAYQWRANGVAIAGATTAAYVLPASLQGKQLSVAVTARAAGQPTVTAVSAAAVVKGIAPKATKAPAVSGAVRVGSKVAAVVGTWSPAPTSYAYQSVSYTHL